MFLKIESDLGDYAIELMIELYSKERHGSYNYCFIRQQYKSASSHLRLKQNTNFNK